MRRLLLLLFASSLWSPLSAEAAAPRREWRTIQSPNFRAHFHEGDGQEAQAQRVVAIAEATLPELARIFGSTPETPIHLVVTDETDSSNGFAEVLPNNVITLFLAVPEPFSTLGDYDDYLRLLVIHELTHVVHLDMAFGPPAWVNQILGRTLVPNGVQPQWFIEGVAVWIESKLTGGGRGRSRLIDLYLRSMVLSGRLPTLDRLTHFTRIFPGGGLNWYVGGRLVEFIAERHGDDAIQQIALAYASRLIPYAFNLVIEDVTGESVETLFDAWVESERRAALAVVEPRRAAGVVSGAPLACGAPLCLFPRFGPDGRRAWVEQPRNGDAELVFTFSDGEQTRLRTADGRGAFLSDGRFVATTSDTDQLVFGYTDLELIDPVACTRRRLTHGARLFEPDTSTDGRIVAVGQEAGQTYLALVSLSGQITRIPGTPLGAQLSEPTWAPDGTIVVSQLDDRAARHLWRYDPQRGPLAPLTFGPARDLDPVVSADGAAVYFSRDAGGVYDLYRLGLDDGRLDRLTRVESGAFQPALSPDGAELHFVLGTAEGWSLRAVSSAMTPLPLSEEGPRPEMKAEVPDTAWPTGPYRPWASLLPRAYLPSLGLDGVGDTVGVFVSGIDAVKQHNYSFLVEYGLTSQRLGYSLSYNNRQTALPLSLSSSLVTTSWPGRFVPERPADDVLLSIWRARLGVGLNLGRWDGGHYLALSYGVELRRGLDPPPTDPFARAPNRADLTLASTSLIWVFSEARGFAEGYGAAAGQSFDVSVSYQDPRLGSDLRVLELGARWSGYLTLPWLEHHVLAGRLAAAGAAGDPGQRSVYALGGLPVRDILSDAIDRVGFGSEVIRGYEVAALRGNAYYLGSLEYRLPIFGLSRGYATLPFFIDRLYAAAFVDAGATPIDRLDLTQLKVGVGAELRLDLYFGYYLGYTLRLGYARGLSEGGIDNWFLVLGGIY
ncbi:MAG: PD40 domain-containing protein [Deltaproteobacteria bacterium]|nr:PD40 domain-containing protein [Deltaproteobacteria bacterium]